MTYIIIKILKIIILPPGCFISLGVLAYFLRKRLRLISKVLGYFSIIMLLLCSLPITAQLIIGDIGIGDNKIKPITNTKYSEDIQAIVVLGCGSQMTPTLFTRLSQAAKIHRKTNIPLLTSGGKSSPDKPSEAWFMKEILENDFRVSVKWLEEESKNTFQNAQLSYKLLTPHSVNKIYLVTDNLHMPRAKKIFEKAGFDVIAAPAPLNIFNDKRSLNLFIPNAYSFIFIKYFFHEKLGRIYYNWRY